MALISSFLCLLSPVPCVIYNPILPALVAGAFQWERLEEDIKKKLKDPEKTEHVLEKVKCILKTPGKVHLTLLG